MDCEDLEDALQVSTEATTLTLPARKSKASKLKIDCGTFERLPFY
jgi:hypothetical protein